MHMPLPQGMPTLRAFATGNLTRPDNVFCSAALHPAYMRCETLPGSLVNTDHLAIIQELDIEAVTVEFEPRPMYKKTDWNKYREDLMMELLLLDRRDHFDSVESVEEAIQALEEAIQRVTERHVRMSKPSPYTKNWFGDGLKLMKRDAERLLREAFRQRFVPEHPVHEESRLASSTYCKAVKDRKASFWVEWLAGLGTNSVWTASKFVSMEATD
ncbi:hypothetical protein C8R43DRAFT_821130, partial [Mycena crocata]